jgi:Glycosyl transferase family 2
VTDSSGGPSATGWQEPHAGPRLSICIATYNRATFIGETLDSIVPQLSKEVELVVVDGASTDETESIVERIASLCSFVRYVRLREKGGVDRDFCKAVELARGEYCWLFADDDLIGPGAIARVLSELRAGYDLVIVNARVMDLGLSVTLKASLMELETDEYFRSDELERLFMRIVPYVSFIGGVVIKRGEDWGKIGVNRVFMYYLAHRFRTRTLRRSWSVAGRTASLGTEATETVSSVAAKNPTSSPTRRSTRTASSSRWSCSAFFRRSRACSRERLSGGIEHPPLALGPIECGARRLAPLVEAGFVHDDDIHADTDRADHSPQPSGLLSCVADLPFDDEEINVRVLAGITTDS